MPRNTSPRNTSSRNTYPVQKSASKSSLPSPQPINYQQQYPQQYSQQPTFFQSMTQGFGLGMGSSIARNIFETKQPVVIHETNKQQIDSSPLRCNDYIKCLKLDDYSKSDCLSNLEKTEYTTCEKLYR